MTLAPERRAQAPQPGAALVDAVLAARKLALDLERGQARTPLADRLDAIVAGAKQETLRLLCLRLGTEERPRVGTEAVDVRMGGAVLRTIDAAGACTLSTGEDDAWRGHHLLVVAGPANAHIEGGVARRVQEAAGACLATVPLVEGGSEGPAAEWTASPWLGKALLPTVFGRNASVLLARLARENDPLAGALRLAGACRSLREVVLYMGERHAATTASLTRRHQSLNRAGRTMAAERPAQDGELGSLGALVDVRCTELERELAGWAERQRLAPEELGDEALELVESLGPEDLERERGAKTIKLTLSERFVEALGDSLRERLEHEWVQAEARVTSVQSELVERVEGTLARGGHAPPQALPAAPDEAPVRAQLEALSIDPRFRGDLPRRGLFQRLSHARRPVFMVLMMLMLFGGLFGVSRRSPVLSSIMIALFFGGIVYTFFDWRREDADKVGRELERLRDRLGDLVRSAVGEFARDLVGRLSRHTAEVQRALLSGIDGAVATGLEQRRTRTGAEDRERGHLLRGLECRLRAAQGTGGLAADAEQASGEADRALADGVRAAAQEVRP